MMSLQSFCALCILVIPTTSTATTSTPNVQRNITETSRTNETSEVKPNPNRTITDDTTQRSGYESLSRTNSSGGVDMDKRNSTSMNSTSHGDTQVFGTCTYRHLEFCHPYIFFVNILANGPPFPGERKKKLELKKFLIYFTDKEIYLYTLPCLASFLWNSPRSRALSGPSLGCGFPGASSFRIRSPSWKVLAAIRSWSTLFWKKSGFRNRSCREFFSRYALMAFRRRRSWTSFLRMYRRT